MITSTDTITLALSIDPAPLEGSERATILQELWHELQATSVDALQASTPLLSVFANECLLCAFIYKACPPDPNPLNGELVMDPIGIVYVTVSLANSTAGEANIGIVVGKEHRRKGYARDAVYLVLRWAFEELNFHRVQVAVMDGPGKDRPLKLFTGLGFGHEGTRRRSAYRPEEGVVGGWRDVAYLALLDTEWVLRECIVPGPVNMWDEMLARHAREREELALWEDKCRRIKKMSSTETVRDADGSPNTKEPRDSGLPDFSWSYDGSSASSQSSDYGSLPPSPRLQRPQADEVDPFFDTLPRLSLPRIQLDEAEGSSGNVNLDIDYERDSNPTSAYPPFRRSFAPSPPNRRPSPSLLTISRPSSSYNPRLSMLRTIPSTSDSSAQTPISMPPGSALSTSSLFAQNQTSPTPENDNVSHQLHVTTNDSDWTNTRHSIPRRSRSSSISSSGSLSELQSPISGSSDQAFGYYSPYSWSEPDSSDFSSGSEWDMLDSAGASGSDSDSPMITGLAL
ncbi:hypothetical protein BJ138DRAFT_1164499 [Hygrophoropsis aurantiaca]|uniref:Uncharacterized protein n=1 Tax=Hygrophoropsis aurantiaca TaxID=72124 RepID=A0ACB7ZXR0_9AGAM|nr:hypothetical protein BJ138DRAFT_1164499 [Hygrophoropsis aurantiaca]